MDRFQELLWDLGKEIDVPLHVDKNNACKIIVEETLPIQLEMSDHDKLLVVTWLAELPSGRFREDVLKEAMKINASYHPSGFFAYIEKVNMLALYNMLMADTLNGRKLASFLESFFIEAKAWHQAITAGHAAPPSKK